MANTKNLINFAKGKDKKTKPPTAKKSTEKKPLSPEEERDLKAKETVNKLLEGVEFTPKNDDVSFEIEEAEQPKNVEWLTEQVNALTSENELFKNELAIAKADYTKIFEENQRIRSGAGIPHVANDGVLVLFDELQNNYLRYPPNIVNQTNVNVRYLLNRMCELFPEVNKIKKF
jgi:hypothetical protein